MGSTAQLSPSALVVRPGETTTATVTVRNTGTVVDRFSFEALGAASQWASFSPDILSLFPEATGTVQVTFAPPKLPSVTAAAVPFAVSVKSAEDPEGSVVEEGSLDVLPFSDVGLELVPRVVYGRRAGMARLAVDNRSNCSYDGELSAGDPAGALDVAFRPRAVSVPAGGAQFVRVRIRPRRTFWRGPSQSRAFRLTLGTGPAEGGPHPAELHADGSLLQEALLPKWVAALAAAVVALAALAVILWFALLKPQIRDSASSQVAQQLAAAGITPSSPTQSTGSGSSGSKSSPGVTGSAVTTPPVSTVGSGVSPASEPVTVNGSQMANGNGTSTVYSVPTGRVLQVTDLLVQNAAGDTGTLAIARDGTVLMQWSMANFRDLDYHWIEPTIFGPGTKLEMIVSGCTDACRPGVYFAGTLARSS